MTFSLLAASEVVIFTTSGAARDDNIVNTMTFSLPWMSFDIHVHDLPNIMRIYSISRVNAWVTILLKHAVNTGQVYRYSLTPIRVIRITMQPYNPTVSSHQPEVHESNNRTQCQLINCSGITAVLVEDCANSIAPARKLPQSSSKRSKCPPWPALHLSSGTSYTIVACSKEAHSGPCLFKLRSLLWLWCQSWDDRVLVIWTRVDKQCC